MHALICILLPRVLYVMCLATVELAFLAYSLNCTHFFILRRDNMVCPRCQSQNVTTQIINEVEFKKKRHGFIWWCIIGWWWVPFKWLFLTFPALIVAMFGGRKKAVNKQKTMCVCQQCGNTWQI